MTKMLQVPEYVIESSWEVCNMVGGIYTVLSTKAHAQSEQITKNHIVIGPDLYGDNPAGADFIPEESLYADWKKLAKQYNINVKTGYWDVPGKPVAILVDFKPFYSDKNKVFGKFWELYQLDSISGHDDYIESAIFGYACGVVIESFCKFYLNKNEKVVAHFHEWMTAAGVLHLRDTMPHIATAFTTHATVTGRSIAGKGMHLYDHLFSYDGTRIASEHQVLAKHSIEQKAAFFTDSFTTVSDITAEECKAIVGKPVDVVTPNGFEDRIVPQGKSFKTKKEIARKTLNEVTKALTGTTPDDDTIYLASSGRYEFYNKGLDVYVDALKKVQEAGNVNKRIVAFVLTPANQSGAREDLQTELNNLRLGKPVEGIPEPNHTHGIWGKEHDPILSRLKWYNPVGAKSNVDIIFVPAYLDGKDGIFNLRYYDLLLGFDLTVFPSYYEPWGYTPLESVAFGVPTFTTSLSGFGKWISSKKLSLTDGAVVLERNDHNYQDVVNNLAAEIEKFSGLNKKSRALSAKNAFELAKLAKWETLIQYYKEAYDIALKNIKKRK